MSVHTASSSSTASSVFAIEWNCHCCTAINSSHVKKCRVCGRPDTYAIQGYHLPFHGKNAKLFRPGQILTALESIHEVDSEGWGSLHSACANGNSDIVKELLKLKAKVEAITNKGETPMHLAVFAGSYECVTLLLKHKAKVNVVTFEERKTPLHMACESGFAKIAQLLILNGADIHAVNIMQRTSLHLAAVSGRTDLGLLLLRAGAKYDVIDAQGWTPRQIAELFQKREFQELMIRQNMTEKQAVFKDLPPAPWHSNLWNQVVTMQAQRHEEYEVEKERQAQDDNKFSLQRLALMEAETERKRAERQAELLIQHNNRPEIMMQQALDRANHKAALSLLKGTPLAVADNPLSGSSSSNAANSKMVKLKKETTALSIIDSSQSPSGAVPSSVGEGSSDDYIANSDMNSGLASPQGALTRNSSYISSYNSSARPSASVSRANSVRAGGQMMSRGNSYSSSGANILSL